MNSSQRAAGAGALSRLLYTSRPAIDGAPEDVERCVRHIARVAAERNAEADITGMLIYASNAFIQILEGPADRVERIFEEICCDERHCEISLVDVVPVGSRMFGPWHMAFLSDWPGTAVGRRDELRAIEPMIGIDVREAQRQMRHLLDGDRA